MYHGRTFGKPVDGHPVLELREVRETALSCVIMRNARVSFGNLGYAESPRGPLTSLGAPARPDLGESTFEGVLPKLGLCLKTGFQWEGEAPAEPHSA